MKKTILCLILALAILFSCASPAFAADSGEWVLHENALHVTHDGTTYVRIDTLKTSDYNGMGYDIDEVLGYSNIDLMFDSMSTQSQYDGSQAVVRTKNKDRLVEVFSVRTYTAGYWLYIAEGYMDTFTNMQNGYAESYTLKTTYNIEMELKREDYLAALENPTTITHMSSTYYEWVDLYSTDPDTRLSVLSGAVLREKSTGAICILRYSDYDTSYFYADGSFARLDYGRNYRVYKITDEALIDDVYDLINARPDDDLDWLAGTEPGYATKLISAIFFFVIIPLGLIVFSAIMLKKCKKKMYRAPFIVLMSSAAVLLITAIIVYI